VPAATLKPSLFNKMLADDPLTDSSLQGFAADWNNNRYNKQSMLII
jgi:hypothetical protein